MRRFNARIDILPDCQKRLWAELNQLPRCFVLYGGTAIALRLGHRQSVDFDFFSSDTFNPEQLLNSIPFLSDAKILQNEIQTLTVVVQRGGPVKVSFFGGLTMGRVRDPEETSDGVLFVASMLDLAGMKAVVVQKRAEAKDYLDLLAIMENGISLPEALGAAQALYRGQYNPLFTLKALSYFNDGDLHLLTPRQKARLCQEASQQFEIPGIPLAAPTLAPDPN
jgi:hypothetical protein